MIGRYRAPGVSWIDEYPPPAVELRTGVPVFLGAATPKAVTDHAKSVWPLTRWPQFTDQLEPRSDSYLRHAVRGFFENGGSLCYVAPLADYSHAALKNGLERLAALDTIDLVCAPDIMRAPAEAPAMQREVLDHCSALGDRFAILDALPGAGVDGALDQRRELSGANGALYFPWIDVGLRDADGKPVYVPPCGHVAGIYERSDERVGVHKAPANERLEGVLDLQVNLTDKQQGRLNDESVNCLRSFPGRGIRVWGARTLSQESAWRYVSTRRLFLTAGRWVAASLADVAFEPNDPLLWARIERELTAYFNTLFQRGALRGATPQEAFYVRCDATTNPPAAREEGEVIAEIGLAPGLPNEFVDVRMIHGTSGVTIAGSSLSE